MCQVEIPENAWKGREKVFQHRWKTCQQMVENLIETGLYAFTGCG